MFWHAIFLSFENLLINFDYSSHLVRLIDDINYSFELFALTMT